MRITVAASLAIAITATWLLVNTTTPVALAQVIESTLKHRLVKYKIQNRAEVRDDLKARYVGDATNEYAMYSDLTMPRMRLEKSRESTLNGVAEQSWDEILDYGADRWLSLYRFDLILSETDTTDEKQKQAIRMLLADKSGPGVHQRLAKLFRAPLPNKASTATNFKPYSDMGKEQSFLQTLRTLQTNNATVSSKEMLYGQEATKYRLKEGGWTSTVWVDVSSKLPIRIEYDLVGETAGKMFASRKWTYTDFEWDPTVDNIDALFSTTAPQGYVLENHTNDQ